MPKEDKETSKVLKELEYWKAQFDKDEIASFYTIKEAQETQTALKAHEKELQEHKEVIENALNEAKRDIETIEKEVMESSLDSKSALSHSNNTLSYTDNIPNGHTERSEVSKEAQLDVSPFSKAQHDKGINQYDKGISEYDKQVNQHDNTIKHDSFSGDEMPYKMEVEFDKIGMQEFQRKIESGEIQLDKATQRHLDNVHKQYNDLLEQAKLLEQDLQSFKALDENNILKTNSTLISQTQRVLNALQDDISFTKEAIKGVESEIATSSKALIPLNTHAETKKDIHAFSNLLDKPKEKDISPLAQYDKEASQYGTTGSHVERSETSNVTQGGIKPSFATNLIKPQNNNETTQALIPYNNTQANNALIPYNTPQDTKLLAYNETKLLEYKETLHALQKLDKSFKDFMSMPFSIIVDSKGNALPLTSQALKNFIFHNLYKEFLNTRHALKAPTLQLNFKPLHNEIKALPYKANANIKAHLKDINAKTNNLLDSMHEFKKTTKEIKLLPYNKPTENKAVEADRFSNVLGEMQSKNIETFTDSYGKTHEIPKEIAQTWKNTFNLQSLDEAYIPNFTPEVKQALDSVLQGEEIKLYAGSLVKLMQRDRLEFLPYIKESLEHSDIVIKDKENALIFAKDIGQTSYFTSVSKNDNGEWVISTNSYKTINQLKNRVNDSGEILYLSKEAPNILAEAFTTKAFSNELANDIIPQDSTTHMLENFKKEFNIHEKPLSQQGM